MRLQHDTRESTLNTKPTRNQETIVHQSLQLQDYTHTHRNANGTRRRGRSTACRVVKANDVVGIRHHTVLSSDRTCADDEVVPGQTESTRLHHHPSQAQRRTDIDGNAPLLRAKAVVRLEDLHLERHLTRRYHVANTRYCRIALVRCRTRDVGKAYQDYSSRESSHCG